MGHGIAVALAMAGRRVAVHDPQAAALDAFPGRAAATLEQIGGDASAITRIEACGELAAAVRDAECVFEAGPELLEVKQGIFEQLERLAPPQAILASNTSAIPIGEIAARVRERGRVLGAHFWNPPYAVRLVEVTQAAHSDASAVASTMALLADCGMIPVHVRRDVPGFIGNRLQHALKREAIALVAAGVCDAATLDLVVREGFGARLAVLGPLEQSDMIGLALTREIHRTLMPHLDKTATVHPFLEAKVAAGETGMDAGLGFRRWSSSEACEVRERFRRFTVAAAREACAKLRCNGAG
jgi:3-hydroxybutyryl-CoA dehydrogenase